MFTEKQANIIRALVEEELTLITESRDARYMDLIALYRDTLLDIINNLKML